MKIIWIVRHSIRDDMINRHLYIGNNINHDPPITKDGIIFARNKARQLDYNQINDIDIIYSSPYLRTMQTAYQFQKILNAPIVEDILISESHTRNTYNQEPVLSIELKTKLMNRKIKFPESHADIKKRVKKFLYHISNTQNKHIVIITHGHIYVELLRQTVSKNIKWFQPNYCDLTKLKYDEKTGKATILYTDIQTIQQ